MMRRLVVVFLLGATPVLASAAPPDDLKAHCASKWSDSYQMQAFCVKQETEARTNVSTWATADAEIYGRCWRKWDSWQMVDFCGKQERGARDQLQGRAAPPPVPPASPVPPSVTSAPAPVLPAYDRDALDACSMLFRGIDTYLSTRYGPGLVRDMNAVAGRAGVSPDPYVRNGAEILRRATSPTQLISAAHTFASTCKYRVVPQAQTDLTNAENAIDAAKRTSVPVPLPDRPSRPISQDESDRQLKGVLEREKATDAKCTKKQYGTGWVTVCE